MGDEATIAGTGTSAEPMLDPWSSTMDYDQLWALYREFRVRPPSWNELHGGYWTLSRYTDVREAAVDPRTYSSAAGVVLGQGVRDRPFVPVELDPPDHSAYRALLQPLMTRAELARLTPVIAGHVSRLVDEITEQGRADVVATLCEPLPVTVISALVGLDQDEAVRMRSLAHAISEADREHSAAALSDFQSFLLELIEDRRRTPRADHLTRLTQEKPTGELMSDDVLVTLIQGLVLAGHHTTITALSFLLWRIGQLGLLPQLHEQPKLHGGAAHEALRLDPAIHLQGRTLTREVTVDGMTMAAGDYVLLLFASANRDETKFERPDEFDPRRAPQYLTFGHGIHRCVGMPLARLEMETVVAEVSKRWRSLDIVEPPEIDAMLFGHHVGMRQLLVDVVPR